MNLLPSALGGPGGVMGWRLDRAAFAPTWDVGIGAEMFGGRWNSVGTAAVYASLDPATAIMEVAVHKGFAVLDTQAHVLTGFQVDDAADVHVVAPAAIPNANWLRPGPASAGQRAFGDALLAAHKFIVLPSVVTALTWNIVFSPAVAAGSYTLSTAEPFALDPRLHPPSPQAGPSSSDA